jgi:glycerol-3-phosphate O-acyltransferase/dihydroxyacetone phosphate acyltransferase
LQKQLSQYHNLLSALRLSDADIALFAQDNVGVVGVTASLVARTLKLLVDLPLFLPGLLFHCPVFLIARVIDRVEKYEECKAQDKIFSGVAVLTILYILLFRYLWSFSGYSLVGLLVALSLTVIFIVYHTALIDDRYEHFTSIVAAWRMFKAVTTRKGVEGVQVVQAVELRQECTIGLYRCLELHSAHHDGALYLQAYRNDIQHDAHLHHHVAMYRRHSTTPSAVSSTVAALDNATS